MLTPKRLSLTCLALSSLLAGCSVDADASTPAPAEGVTPNGPTSTTYDLAWSSCKIPTELLAVPASCATIEAPARRDVVTDAKVTVAVYKLPATTQPARAQVWMLNGGPGGAGFGLAYAGQKLQKQVADDVDIYMVDHRGTGESMFLECDSAASAPTDGEYGKLCSEEIRKIHGDVVDGFSTTESAHDVRELIDATVADGQKVFVYGASYGSYWAHRLLQLPDVHVDAVITEGNCIGPSCSFDTPQAFQVDPTMRTLMAACKRQTDCSSHLGPDPWAFGVALIDKLAKGHCSEARLAALSPTELVMRVAVLHHALVAPVLFRLDRCAPNDLEALEKVADLAVPAGLLAATTSSSAATVDADRAHLSTRRLGGTPNPSSAKTFSTALQLHVVASELISKPAPSIDELARTIPSLTYKPSKPSLDNAVFDAWHGYPKSEYVGRYVERDIPWLMLQGTIDFQTAVSASETALEHLEAPSLQYVKIEGGHSVAFESDCAMKLMTAFLRDPKAKVDTGCLADVASTSLSLGSRNARFYLGSASAWD